MSSFITKLAMMAGLCLGMSACMMLPTGPDLDKTPSPFGDAARITLSTATTDQFSDIIHTDTGDTMMVSMGEDMASQSYEAALTYRAFDPGDAALANAYDYWLIAGNIFRTRDRSYYAILRLPKGATFTSGTSLATDMLMLSCMGLAKLKVQPDAPLNPEEMASQLYSCDFASMEALLDAAPKLVQRATEVVKTGNEDGSAVILPTDEDPMTDTVGTDSDSYLTWIPVKITIP